MFLFFNKCWLFAALMLHALFTRTFRGHHVFTLYGLYGRTQMHLHACTWAKWAQTHTHTLTHLHIHTFIKVQCHGYFHRTSGMHSVSMEIYFETLTKKGQLLKYAIMFPLTEEIPFPLMQKGGIKFSFPFFMSLSCLFGNRMLGRYHLSKRIWITDPAAFDSFLHC